MKINNENYEAKIKENSGNSVLIEVNGIDYKIELESADHSQVKSVQLSKKETVLQPTKTSDPKTHSVAPGAVLAPIPGLVLRISVKEGDQVQLGDTILVLEAMKMESEIASTAQGVVKKIKVTEGQSVQEDDVLIEVGE